MKVVFIIGGMLLSTIGFSQTILTTNNGILLEMYDISGRPVSTRIKTEINGNPLLNENWGTGTVKLASGRVWKNATLRFNLLTNQLFYLIDNSEFPFAEPITEFSLSYIDNGNTIQSQFKNGYPGTALRAEQIFYEILASGKRFELLKHQYKTIHDYYEYGSAVSKTYRMVTELCVYDKQTKLLTTLTNKQSLNESLPALAEAITQLLGTPPAKITNEKDLAVLITRLDQ